MSQCFESGGQSIGVSASASVLPMNIQDSFPFDGLVGSPCSPRDSQDSSPTPQFKSINSLALSFLYSLTFYIYSLDFIFLFFPCCSYSLRYISLLYLPLFNIVFLFFISFLPYFFFCFFTMFISLFCFCFFIAKLAYCFRFIFKFKFLLKRSESEVAQSGLTLCNPMNCSLWGSSIHGIFQARLLELVAIAFSRWSSWHRDWTRVSHIVGRHFTFWASFF